MILTTPVLPLRRRDDPAGQGAGGDRRGPPGQGDAAGRALGSARRRPDVVSGKRPTTPDDRPPDRLRLRRRHRPRRRRHDRPAVRRRPRPQGRPADRGVRHGRRGRRGPRPRPRGAVGDGPGRHPGAPELRRLATLVLRIQRELFVVGAELATNPEARSKARDGETRVSAAMVDGMDEHAPRDGGRDHRSPGSSSSPARPACPRASSWPAPILRRAERRAVTLSHPRRGLADSRLLPYLNRLADLLWILARVAEQAEARQPPPRDPTAGSGHHLITAPVTTPSPQRSDPMSGTNYPPAPPAQYTPAQLGVRPAPALVQQLLVGAFGWMFAGLLLSAGVAYLVGTSEQLLQRRPRTGGCHRDRPVRPGHRDPGGDQQGLADDAVAAACSSSTRRRWASRSA